MTAPNSLSIPGSSSQANGHLASTRVLLVAFESVDWDLLAPLIGSGQLPNLAALIENGVIADLASLQPAVPALLWTSLATGVRAIAMACSITFKSIPFRVSYCRSHRPSAR